MSKPRKPYQRSVSNDCDMQMFTTWNVKEMKDEKILNSQMIYF